MSNDDPQPYVPDISKILDTLPEGEKVEIKVTKAGHTVEYDITKGTED